MNTKILLVILFFSFFSCKKSDTEAFSSDEESIQAIKISSPSKEKSEVGGNYGVPTPENKNIAQKIIKNGNIKFECKDLETTYEQIKTAVKKGKAIIQNDNEGKDYGTVYRKLTVRIPSENFDFFIKDISTGVAYFDNKEISSQDVTEEYIDIDARLKAKKKLENRYLELLSKATKMSEMLAIEAQLSAIREEVEAKEGQLRYLQSQVSLSTINIEFYKTVAEEGGITVSYGEKVWNAIKSGFNSISSFFLGMLEVWPFLLIATALIYFIRKRFKKKNI